ncbi:MAG: Asp-tRNA(Asn)/Glu-tRNA(Gln) amidotransferase subunit GatC [Lentisphaerota bacterium]
MTNKESLQVDVSYVAALARLKINEEEQSSLQKDMNEIVTYIDMLSELDVSTVQPTMYAIDMKNVWREDICIPSDVKNTIIKNAPANIDGELIKVPQVIPGEGIS